MSKHTRPVLPFDVIGNIIDILIDDSNTTKGLQDVKAFSLTCQSSLPFCRKHIFSSIHIKTGMSFYKTDLQLLRDIDEFGQFLLESPGIARYIRQLKICILDSWEPEFRYAFAYFPRELTRLQSLQIYYPYSAVGWDQIPLSMQSLLLNIMHLPTLSHLHMARIEHFPISNLINCTDIKHLSVDSLCITGEHDQAVYSLLQKPMHLQTLDLKLTDPRRSLDLLAAKCSDGRPFLNFTGLKKISILVNFLRSWSVVPIQEIFRHTRQLEDIHIEGMRYYMLYVPFIWLVSSLFPFFFSIAIDHNFKAIEFAKAVSSSLQTLSRVHLSLGIGRLSRQDPLAGLCDELAEIVGNNKLESLEIEINMEASEDGSTGDEWGRLEKVLLKPGWPVLKHVSLDIFLWTFTQGLNNLSSVGVALKGLPQTQFAGLTSDKNLAFRFSVQTKLV